ncbi:WecA-like glycosyltransferase [Thalassoglobus neptunius]|uniref:WecA-like glycosyltransferase n=1 Tax=Thalassoglobus neptunius TaxID=1938619 RepID=A0A5C5X6B9_9PLAN|nr:MraY family glycosyltransferase [Thalassoglobus neptunius]TWT58464.1 WecA-like glycosyltransferase [Thalassoglobus neptunius]
MIWFIVGCIAPAFLISFVVTRIVQRYAETWGLVDQPAARKVHVTPTPLGGGIAIYFGFLLPILAAQIFAAAAIQGLIPSDWIPELLRAHFEGIQYRAPQFWTLMAGGTVLAVMGLVDDRFGLSWKIRLVVQFLVAGMLVLTGTSATIFVSVPWFGMLVSVVWIVVLINSLNFLDNMDGLSAGIGLIASLMFASVMLSGTSEPRWLVGGALLVLSGSLGGFLVFNWPPASIFMGDAGSTFLGMMLASLTLLGTFYDSGVSQTHVILAPLCILAVPLYDFTSVMLIRLSQGRSPFQPDKSHFSHRLTGIGLSRTNAVLTVHFATLTTGLGALLLYHVDDWSGAMLVIALVLCTLVIVSILEMAAGRANNQEKPNPPAPSQHN